MAERMEWERILADSVKDGAIKELHLSKIPVLKTTTNWRKVELVGWVDHQTKHAHYKGGIVRLNSKLYFVRDATIRALQEFMKWDFPTKIQVIK